MCKWGDEDVNSVRLGRSINWVVDRAKKKRKRDEAQQG